MRSPKYDFVVRVVTAALVIGGAAGCGGGDDGLSEDEFCQEYARRECTGAGIFCGFPMESCLAVRAQACRDESAKMKGPTRPYVAANVGRCLDLVKAAYDKPPILAATMKSLKEACARVFQGSTKAIQPCTIDYECEKDLICDKGRCGARREVAAAGQCANVGEICPAGEFCKRSPDIWICGRRQDMGAACSAADPCLERLRCVGTCQPRVAAGGVCATADDCETGYCDEFARLCLPGLSFATGSDSCRAFAGEMIGGRDAGATTD